ncbi:MAG: LysR family transcriptional regulator [Olsenella sp.]|jgi:DNA-binding transcriptional LysR family regulator|nr:LysR family transcriptional regulator [Olsenella sp.]MCI1288676.1 LysR family transcriptional regulator [Olsenella sp.]
MAAGVDRYEIFLKVAELGNITRAAEELSYTQSGVSHAVRSLEQECGTPLLSRGKTGVTLTQNGQLLLPRIQALVNQKRALEQAIQEVNHVVAGTLRVGTFTSVSTQWLPSMISRFQKLYPQVTFQIFAGGYDEIAQRIARGQVDCGFLTSIASGDGLTFSPLKRDQMMVVLPKGHPLAEKDEVTVQEVAREDLVMPLRGSEQDIRAALADARGQLKVRYALNDDFSAMAMVEHGFGVSVMPRLILRNSAFDVDVRPLSPASYRTIGIATLEPEGLTAVASTFVRFLKDRNNADLLR